MNQGREDPLSLGSDDEQVAGSRATDTKRDTRSSSPAKRRASAMEDGHMDVEQSGSDARKAQTNGTSKSSSKQHTREASVDMLSGSGNSGSASTLPSSVSETPADEEMDDAEDIPSIDEQVLTILEEMGKDIEDGAKGYLVATAWINRVLARSSQKDDHGPFSKDVLEGDVGPIDNSPILLDRTSEQLVDDHGEKFVQIKSGLSVSNDLEIFTERAFKLAKKWYGLAPGQPEIKRYAHATNPDGPDLNVQYELYPPVFTLRKVHAAGTTFDKHATEDGKQKAPRIVSSRSAVFQSFLKRAKESTGVPMSTKVKLWRELNPESVSTDIKITVTNDGQMPSPPESREPSPNRRTTSQPLLLSAQKFKEMPEAVAREMIDMKDETSNDKYNGSVQLGVLGLGADQVLILEEQASNGTFASDSGKKATKGAKKGGLLSSTSSGRSSPALGPVTRGRNRSSGRTPGSVGLGNLGNTCYMNSALQCLRSTEELTSFFLAKAWKKELNKGNPLGHEGKMATSYASLLDSIYDTNSSSFTPVDFKRTLSKCGPQFSGYGQQDSQEFMSFLVDALHEDMNRIHQKPYIENPDSDDSKVKDEEYIKELGNIFRENYRKRNDSVIHDLFNGFYKNTMVCPDCDKVSVTFDPYLLLTLQLPLEHSWQHTVYFWPLHGEPVRVEIDMDKHATIKQLKEYVANKVPGLEAKRVMMAEVFGKKFYRTVEDKQTIAEANIQARDDMFLYELDEAPTNFPPPKRKKKSGYRSMLFTNDDDEEADIPGDDSPMAEVMMVPVFQRVKNQYGGGRSLTSTPFFITVNREEAKNYQEIYRKVVARIASITTRDFLHELSLDNENSSENEQDRADEDATSGTEGDVQARSVDSEDGVVEVSVSKQHAAKGATSASQAFPAVLNAGTPMPKALLDLFELNILDKGSEMVPTGFNTVDERRTLKSLRSRTPLLSRRGSVDAATPGSSESSDVDELTTRAQPSFANGAEASEEDDDFVVTKNKKLKTYSKKNRATNGNKSASSEDEEVEHDLDATTDEPILHLGECLVIDWGYDQYDALFEGSSPDDMRGQLRINKDMPLLDDKELKEKRMKRTERKRNGITLDECFKVTAQGEILTEDNAWYCNRCKELRRAEKTLEIWTAPDILCIHLKRFSAARQFRDKIDILVEFPIEGLNLNDKVGLTEDKDLIYDLFAVDNHYGGLGGGHYTAYAKNFVDEQWYEYNDSSVSKRQPSSVITPAAYLLFYRRRTSGDQKYLGAPELQKLVENFREPQDEDATSAEEDEESESRGTSPSGQGKGLRLGGSSFPNGLSSSSAGQGAGRLHRRGGDGSGAADRGTQAKSAGALRGPDGYEGDDDDEGYGGGVDDDADDVLPDAQPTIGPHLPSYQESQANAYSSAEPYSSYQTWSFAGIPETNRPASDIDADGDADSMGMMDNDDNDASARLMEDFGDEDLSAPFTLGHQNSPILESTEMDFLGDQMTGVVHTEDSPPAVEIHIDSPPGSHEKKD